MKKYLLICWIALLPLFLVAQPKVIISELLYQPPYPNEGQHPHMHNGEFISIYNYGNVAVDVSGWRLVSEGGARQVFTFPAGSIMRPGAKFYVAYRGSQTPNFTLESLYTGFRLGPNDSVWYHRGIILNNTGESLWLYRGDGTTLQDRVYHSAPPLETPKNADWTTGYQCFSLQRRNVRVANGTINFNNSDWTAQKVALEQYPRLSTGFTENGVNVFLQLPQTTYQAQPTWRQALNTSYVVGATAGVADVTPTGAATYQIPISIPSGIADVQPNLSIVYNSQTGNGLLGYGWNLAAISSISRTGKTIYHDGQVDAVRMNNTDNLMFDGQRLILTAGTNLANGAEYRTEVETYNQIQCKIINSRLCFEVKTKDGWILEYGTTPDSYIDAQGTSTAFCWLLTKATDPLGNYMTYGYIKNDVTGEFWLKQIDYTGNTAGISPHNRVEFFYETRKDKQVSYVAGRKIEQTVLLKRIRTSSANTTFREYRFNYYYEGFHSKLTEVVEYGESGDRYNSTIVDWGEYDVEYGSEYFSFLQPMGTLREGAFPLYADFNGDGKTDFISYHPSSSEATLFLTQTVYGQVRFVKHATIPLTSNFAGLLLADLNGDGLMDVVRITEIWQSRPWPLSNRLTGYRYDFFFFNGTSFSQSGGFESSSKDAIVGDFTGEGKHQILAKAESRLHNQYGSKIAEGGITWGKRYHDDLPFDWFVIDFTGDGKADLMVADDNGFRIYSLNGTSFSLVYSGTDFKNPPVAYSPVIGDFNGDGKTDILINYPSNQYYILFSTGTGFEKKTLPNLNITGRWFATDFNGDGKTDIVHVTQNNGYAFPLRIGLFDGETFHFENHDSYLIGSWAMNNMIQSWKYLHFADFDGDGFPELCFAGFSDASIIKSFDRKKNQFVQSITDGLNNRVSFYFDPITDNYYHAAATSSYSFPMSKFQQPLYVTTAISRRYGEMSESESFFYRGARLHKQGKGFLGFESVQIRNNNQNRRVVTDYGYDPTYFNVYPTLQKVTNAAGNVNISTTIFKNATWDHFGGKRIFPFMWHRAVTDHLTGLSITTDYQYLYNDDGNIWRIIEKRGDLTTQITNTWAAKGSNFKNRLVNSEVKRSGLQGVFTDTSEFVYDNKGRLEKQINFKGDPKAVTTTYGNFDIFGNPKNITTSATNCPTINITIRYDGLGRPDRKTDAIGTSEANYDNFGRIKSTTAINGLTTYYKYDNFGNLIEETSPVGISTQTIKWDINSPYLYRVDHTKDGASEQSVWYNAAGQVARTRTKDFLGNDVYARNQYNPKGQLIRSYLPEYNATPSVNYIEYKYNALNQLEEEVSTIAGVTNHAFNGLSHTVTFPDGTFRKSILNNEGLTASVTDDAGTINYTYNSFGKPITITAVGLTTTIDYDNRGYQKKLKDPNLTKAILYDYDAYGMLRSQTNAREDETTFEYDDAGRIISEISPEMNLTYHYATSGRGKGQLEYIKTGNTNLRKIVHNPLLGLPQQITETIDGVDYTIHYLYDEYGRLKQKESPSGFILKHEYTNGYLTALLDGNNNDTDIWRLTEINAFGQITSSTFGNGLIRNTAFNPTNLSLHNISLSNGVAPPIDEVAYTFHPSSGNLQQRNDKSNLRNETFGYDINRLSSISMGDVKPQNITYRSDGNIATKFDVGTYLYAKNNHAVSEIYPAVHDYTPEEIGLTHTSFNRTSEIIQGNKTLTFSYNPYKKRNKSEYSDDLTTRTRYYVGSYEKEEANGTTKEFDYIHSPEGLVAIAEKNNGTRSLYYAHTDHLGSLRLLTDVNKNVVSRYHYDAWGTRTLVDGTNITMRGFTGHEHLDEFGLINMNARMYDPVLARFLSPDPYVPDVTYTQDFNRYTYARNNPLSYIDPTGEIVWAPIIFAAVVAGSFNLVMNADKVENVWQGFAYFGVGAAVGGGAALAGGFAATLIPSGILPGIGVGAGTGALIGGTSNYLLNGGNNLIAGNNFNHDWKSSVISGAVFGGITGGIAGGIQGYQLAKARGLNLWYGSDIKHNRNQWSLAWWDKPDRIVFNGVRNTGIGEINCMAKSFQNMYGGTEEYWDAFTNSGENLHTFQNIRSEGGNVMVYPGDNTQYITYENFLALEQSGGRSMITVQDYRGYGEGHAMAVREVLYVPNKRFDVRVFDSYDGSRRLLRNFQQGTPLGKELRFWFINFR
jgi:RHS repeat-associated protein